MRRCSPGGCPDGRAIRYCAQVLNATLADPTSTKLYCEIWAEINNGGPFPEVTLTGFNATLLDLKGRPIGWINYPTVTLNPNGPTIQRILSYLTVIDEEAFHEEGRKLMHGEAIEWDVRGESMVWALGFPFRLQARPDPDPDPTPLHLQALRSSTLTGTLVLSLSASLLQPPFLRSGGKATELRRCTARQLPRDQPNDPLGKRLREHAGARR